MKAAVLRGAGEPLRIEDVDVAEPIGHEVLIRVAAVGVCRSDLHHIEGLYPTDFPSVLGHESAGVVEAVGDQVGYVRPGDHVISCMSVFCGHCESCVTGHLVNCERPQDVRRAPGEPPRLSQNGEEVHQFYHLSSFAEYMLVHEHAIVKVREDMPLDRAALIGCGVTTGVGAVHNTAKIEVGSTVAVIGLGGVGLAAVNGAALSGAGRIIAIDTVGSKLILARQFGATDVVDASRVDPVQAVREMTGRGVHYSFEAIGLKRTSEQAFEMLRPNGTAVVIGMVPVGQKLEIDGESLQYEKTLTGSNMGSNRFRVDMPRYVDFYLAGKLHLDEMITQRIRLDQINEAFDEMKKGEVARSVVVFD